MGNWLEGMEPKVAWLLLPNRGWAWEKWMSVCAVMLCTKFHCQWEKKDAFFATVQDALSAILSDKSNVVLGIFNCRVVAMNDEWWYERRHTGYGELNDVGREYCPFFPSMKPWCTICYYRRRTFRNKPGGIPNPECGST